jgi:dTDP-N-acetylfucosamine:lipid II N-acetylfucosaminyltransferase
MIVHCTHTEKFIGPYISFVNSHFDTEQHHFIVRDTGAFAIEPGANVQLLPQGTGLLRRIMIYSTLLNRADRIVLHGIFERFILFLLLCQPWLLGRTHWVIWGADLYAFVGRTPPTAWTSRLSSALTRFIIGRIGHIVTYIKGDYELACKTFGSHAQHHECLAYLSNVVNLPARPPAAAKTGTTILIGNSADPTNQHEDMLALLAGRIGPDDRIYCPLSYGDKAHARHIADLGRQQFGDRFIALTSFMSLDEYLALLDQVDIAVFAHHRQQGMGNMISLIGGGKKVYLRNTVTPWPFFGQLGLKVFDLEQLDLTPLPESVAQANAAVVNSYFSLATLEQQWAQIFDGHPRIEPARA